MLDLKTVRQDPDGARQAMLRKGEPGAVHVLNELLEADRQHRARLAEVETLRAERNTLSQEVGRVKRAGADPEPSLMERTRQVGERLRVLDAELGPAETRVRELLLTLPNYPDPEVPVGTDESGNSEVRRWGDIPALEAPRAHWDLGVALGLLDFERASKIAGARFTVFTGRGAALVRALQTLMLDMHVRRHGCTEVLPPFVVNADSMQGTGQLPKFAADAFRLEGTDLWLAPTAEVPVTNMYRDEILDGEMLPILDALTGAPIQRVRATISASKAGQSVGRQLEIAPSTPVVVMGHSTLDAAGSVCAYADSYLIPGLFTFMVMRLRT